MTAGCDGLRVRVEGRAGWITLDRPDALNALTWDMCRAIDAALDAWRDDDRVALVMIDGTGRAFCAGGDIAVMHARARAGDHAYGRDFWREEYRLNAKLHRYPKPVVAFLHGYVMGGGVGVGCHASHRLVRDDSRVAMPECAIGLVPDVGGSMILARAPGRLGAFLGVTGHRMGPGDAILTGFADAYVPDGWDDLKARLAETGDVAVIAPASAPPAPLADWRAEVDALFAGADLADIAARAAEGSGRRGTASRAARRCRWPAPWRSSNDSVRRPASPRRWRRSTASPGARRNGRTSSKASAR